MRKPATPGMEDRKGIILQAHMDMVPQKNNDKTFDFTKDPIEAYIDGEWVTANGTTLGADNGMGLAAILAVMGSKTLKHGPLEALITASEETGMDGAFGLKPGVLQGDILLNLDSEAEGELYVGCAGGLDLNVSLTYKEEAVPAGLKPVKIEVKGLLGGHSGIEIILERGNANKIMARLLLHAQKEFCASHQSTEAGCAMRSRAKRQPQSADPARKTPDLREILKRSTRYPAPSSKRVDDGVTVTAGDTSMPHRSWDTESQNRLLNAVQGCHSGVIRMSPRMPGLVQIRPTSHASYRRTVRYECRRCFAVR